MSVRQASPADIAEALAVVAPAEAAFRSRWRMSTFERIDKDLHDRVKEQIDLYSEEMIAGSAGELREQAAAMVRGWAAACACMEGQPDDAYLIGMDWPSRTQVVISDSKQSLECAQGHAHPECKLIALSPDEAAKLVGRMDIVRNAKAAFGQAEIVDICEPRDTRQEAA